MLCAVCGISVVHGWLRGHQALGGMHAMGCIGVIAGGKARLHSVTGCGRRCADWVRTVTVMRVAMEIQLALGSVILVTRGGRGATMAVWVYLALAWELGACGNVLLHCLHKGARGRAELAWALAHH
jgi:hypothetical protein